MTTTVLIATHSNDKDSVIVRRALGAMGANAFAWNLDLFGTGQRGSWNNFDGLGARVMPSESAPLALDGVETVWWRRPVPPKAPRFLHPEDRQVAESESHAFISALIGMVPARTRWVNPRENVRAANKLHQLSEAARVGLTVVETLATSDSREAAAFIRAMHPARVLYKPFALHGWPRPTAGIGSAAAMRVSYANFVTPEQLPSEAVLAACPGIFQRYVEKRHDIRCVVFGDVALAVRFEAPGRIDWRCGSPSGLKCEVFEMPFLLRRQCALLMERLGIVSGSFDFAVDDGGHPVFLEVNESGQFLFLEELCPGLPVLDAFCRFLLDGHAADLPHRSRPVLRLADTVAVAGAA